MPHAEKDCGSAQTGKDRSREMDMLVYVHENAAGYGHVWRNE